MVSGKKVHGQKVPLASFLTWKAQKLEVFELSATPQFTPIDFDLFALYENIGWLASDRLRFWYDLKKIRARDQF